MEIKNKKTKSKFSAQLLETFLDLQKNNAWRYYVVKSLKASIRFTFTHFNVLLISKLKN